MQTFQFFTDLKLPKPLQKALEGLEFVSPTPVQASTIPAALEGRDILATAQTGTGKTGAFGIPTISWLGTNQTHQALILAPTRELAAQIFDVMKKMGSGLKLRGVLVVGGESFRRQVSELDRGCDYIIATPGRLNDHLGERTIDLSYVGILILDEVDRMLDMGFAPQIQKIMRYVPKKRQTMLFSATLPDGIIRLASTFLNNPVRVAVGGVSEASKDVLQKTIQTTNDGKNLVLLKELAHRAGRVLVFTRTQTRAEHLAHVLYREGYDVVCLHGGRNQAQRKQALRQFHAGTHRIMVATDLAGRGIDVADIEHVINYDVPKDREDYIHRIGRTGRFGKTGEAVTFVTPADVEAEQIITGVKPRSRVVFRSRRR